MTFNEKINKIISFCNQLNQKSFSKDFSDKSYLNTWTNNFGYFFLKKKFYKINLLLLLFENFKLLYRKIRLESTTYNALKYLKNIESKKIFNLVISYQTNDNIKYDNFFSCNRTLTKKTLWLILDLNNLNFNLSYDAILIKQKKINLFFALINTIIYFPIWLFKKKNLYEKNLFFILEKEIKNLDKIKINKIFFPYEAKPFERYLIKILKEKFLKSKVIGYVHGGLPALPVEYYFNKLIDKIIVHSKQEKFILIKFFGWEKKRVIVDKSYRHNKFHRFVQDSLYLPYNFVLNYNLYKDLKYLFKNYDLGNLQIKNHPVSKNFIKHQILENIIYKLKNKSAVRKLQKNISVCIGVTGAVFECLENKKKVIHIVNNPEFEIYSKYLWKNFIVKKISDRIFFYDLKNRDRLVQYSKKNYFIKKYKL